jgi:hypothetical protein
MENRCVSPKTKPIAYVQRRIQWRHLAFVLNSVLDHWPMLAGKTQLMMRVHDPQSGL